jgi:hypothetical protein
MFWAKKSNGWRISSIRLEKRGFLLIEAILSITLAMTMVLWIGKICSNTSFLFGQMVRRNLIINEVVNCCESDELPAESDFYCVQSRVLVEPSSSLKDQLGSILGLERPHLPECEIRRIELKSKNNKNFIRFYVFKR